MEFREWWCADPNAAETIAAVRSCDNGVNRKQGPLCSSHAPHSRPLNHETQRNAQLLRRVVVETYIVLDALNVNDTNDAPLCYSSKKHPLLTPSTAKLLLRSLGRPAAVCR